MRIVISRSFLGFTSDSIEVKGKGKKICQSSRHHDLDMNCTSLHSIGARRGKGEWGNPVLFSLTTLFDFVCSLEIGTVGVIVQNSFLSSSLGWRKLWHHSKIVLVPNSLQAHILGPNRIDSSLEEARTLYIKTLTKSGFYCFEQKIEIDEHIEVPQFIEIGCWNTDFAGRWSMCSAI